MTYVRSLPINDTPEIFGLHDNANITYALNETFTLLKNIVLLQPRSSSSGGSSREEVRSIPLCACQKYIYMCTCTWALSVWCLHVSKEFSEVHVFLVD